LETTISDDANYPVQVTYKCGHWLRFGPSWINSLGYKGCNTLDQVVTEFTKRYPNCRCMKGA
jgi:hypothetical protein